MSKVAKGREEKEIVAVAEVVDPISRYKKDVSALNLRRKRFGADFL
jgi:hypothetical protein